MNPGKTAKNCSIGLVFAQIPKKNARIHTGIVAMERKPPPKIPQALGPTHNACAGLGINRIKNNIEVKNIVKLLFVELPLLISLRK